MNCGVGPRQGSDPALLWLWCRLGATAPIRPLDWESPYAISGALKSKKKKKGLGVTGSADFPLISKASLTSLHKLETLRISSTPDT